MREVFAVSIIWLILSVVAIVFNQDAKGVLVTYVPTISAVVSGGLVLLTGYLMIYFKKEIGMQD